jgi:hypothetical protein
MSEYRFIVCDGCGTESTRYLFPYQIPWPQWRDGKRLPPKGEHWCPECVTRTTKPPALFSSSSDA